MPVDWAIAGDIIKLEGLGKYRIKPKDARRQTKTAKTILERLRSQPGVLLADEVGMGKTYVSMAVVASVILSMRTASCPVVVMAPPGLRKKWQRDWEQFKTHCVRDHALDWVRSGYAHTPTEFFKLLDNKGKQRTQLIFITTGCFSQGLYDPWVKLGLIRLARRTMRLTDDQKNRLYRWSADLVRQFSNTRLTEEVTRRLLDSDVSSWKSILVEERILIEEDDDPIPERLLKDSNRIDWKNLCNILRELPGRRPEYVSQDLRIQVRRQFNEACRGVYEQWMNSVRWRSPLLVLDEAHHAKNDSTRLAQLFRQEDEDDIALLKNKFDRMLFLTATPFQLGHQELIRVLQSFAAVRWLSKEAPAGSCDDFKSTMTELEAALDKNRLSGRRFDRYWGKIRSEMLDDTAEEVDEEDRVLKWWRNIESSVTDAWHQQMVQTYRDCVSTKDKAERMLKPWLIRHNRLLHLPGTSGILRRNIIPGKSIINSGPSDSQNAVEGLPIEERSLLPFLITARAQGQLAQQAGTRAFFAEGLASSYEAFHHTRDSRNKVKDYDDGLNVDSTNSAWLVPTKWYEEQIAQLIPSREASRVQRMTHPKIFSVVKRAVDLWLTGEKVIIFCFYIQTAHALTEHLRKEVDQTIINIVGRKLRLDPRSQASEIKNWMNRIVRRFSNSESPFNQEIRSILDTAIDKPEYTILQSRREEIFGVLMAYFRSPSFISRYLPLDDKKVREAFGERETDKNVIAKGLDVLRKVLLDEKDASNQTFLGRIYQFLDFACELAERAEHPLNYSDGEKADEAENPLSEYLDAVTKARRLDRDEGESDDEKDEESYSVMPLVRKVYGDTKSEIRDRMMLAFNSPLFPEILVSSSVMGEGVDLHRFCRHIIHHDLCWNPSTLEQRTGRLDRVRCKAEICSKSIEVYEPFIAGSADEKMFRVLRDRERWFQIVMGQKFEFDEVTSESIANRVSLPAELAKKITFDLSCWNKE